MKRLIHTTSTVLAVLFLLTATGCGTNRTADSGKNADSGQNESPPDSTFQIGDGTDAFADDTHQIAGSTDQITDQITDGTMRSLLPSLAEPAGLPYPHPQSSPYRTEK